MFRNYLFIAIRSLLRYKYFATINLLGLALGLSCSIFIMLWIVDEYKFDAFHKNSGRLYRVMANLTLKGEKETQQSVPGLTADGLKAEIPGVEKASAMTWEIEQLFGVGTESHKEKGRYVQPDFLEMFSYSLASGDPRTALTKPTSILITQKLAHRYFGNENAIGKLIRVDNRNDFEITGILNEVPRNSSIRFDYLLPYDAWLKTNEWARAWENNGPRAYVLLDENASLADINQKISGFIMHKLGDKEGLMPTEIFLQKYDEGYLHSEFSNGIADGGRIDYIKSFSIVAVVVLVIACINFMNMATARSMKRAKEIGVRKASGAGRKSLIAQFMSEAFVFSFLGLAIALLIVELMLPAFRLLTEKDITLPYTDPVFMLALVGIALITGFVSGCYPALFLSSFNAVTVLKGTLRFSTGTISMRKGLVVFQFCLTIVLIFCTLVVHQQIQFIRKTNLGFDRENLIIVNLEGDLSKKITSLVTEASKGTGIKSATVTTSSPLVGGNSTTAVTWPGKQQDEQVLFTQMAVGFDYLRTMGIELAEGRDFSVDIIADSTSYIVNEETVKAMKLEDPIGQEITFWGRSGKIVGVTKNYHVNSLHTNIEPVILHLHPEWSNLMIARAESGKTEEAIAGLQSVVTKMNPAYPFEYHFVDDTFEGQYKSELLVGDLAKYFSSLAIFISCLGLLGLVVFTAEQRTKEIGVRKVLGASVQNILFLLSKDFMVLVAIAFVISTPLAWYLMNDWLKAFAYHTDISAGAFLASALVSLTVAFSVVGYQSFRAATVNPVKSLKSE